MVRMTLFSQSTETLVSDIRSRASCCLAFMGFLVISITPSYNNSGPSCAIALAIRCLGRRRSHPPGPSRCPVQGRELDSTILMSPFQGSIFCDFPKTSSSRPWSGKMVSAEESCLEPLSFRAEFNITLCLLGLCGHLSWLSCLAIPETAVKHHRKVLSKLSLPLCWSSARGDDTTCNRYPKKFSRGFCRPLPICLIIANIPYLGSLNQCAGA